MKKHILLAAAASFAFAPAAFAQDSGKAGMAAEQMKIGAADQTFVTKAAIGGMFEVQSSELAQDKAESPEVKKFADRMVKDHGKANKQLSSLAGDKGAEVPSKLDSKHAQALQKLEGLEGSQFDRTYIQAQRDAHRDAVALFSGYSKSSGDAELTAWAGKTLPILQEHARHVQELSGMAKSEGAANTGRSAAEPTK